MSIKLNLSDSSTPLNPTFLYNKWIQYVKDNKTGYFMLPNSLENYLPYIGSAAINLYVFYAIHAKNGEGHSYYSNETIARTLNVTQKTITNWNKTLQDLGLIIRKSRSNSSSDTYMLPLSDFIIDLKSVNNDKNKVINFLEQEGYRNKGNINLYVTSESGKIYKYNLFERTYSVKDFKMIRKILLAKVEVNNNLSKIHTSDELMWFEKNGFYIVWNAKKSDNVSKNRLDLVSQLDSEDKVNAFKRNYQQLNMGRNKK